MSRCVLVLGAGFSKWSCNLPLVTELFDLNLHADNDVEAKRIVRLDKLYKNWKAENPGGHNEEFVRFAQAGTNNKKLVNWYIVRRLTDAFVSVGSFRKSWYINTYRTQSDTGITKARAFIHSLQEFADVDIVTTNYDLIAEYALGTRGFNYGKIQEQIGFTPGPYMKPVFLKGELRIAKLHGSVSWDETKKYPDSRHGLSGKCLVIPPVHEKVPLPSLQKQWKLASTMLNEAHCLYVFGFSFHENDLAVRKLFAENTTAVQHFVFIDAVDHRSKLASLIGHRTSTFINALDHSLATLIEAALSELKCVVAP